MGLLLVSERWDDKIGGYDVKMVTTYTNEQYTKIYQNKNIRKYFCMKTVCSRVPNKIAVRPRYLPECTALEKQAVRNKVKNWQ